jgi:predicted metal-dependent hydrolase
MDNCLDFHLIRSRRRRKTISLHIKEDGRIAIYVPYHTPKREIERFVKEKEPWIVEKLSEKEERRKEIEKTFLPGEKFFYLGESYPLEIGDAGNKGFPLKLSFGRFIIDKDHLEGARDLFIRWYKREAKEKIDERVLHLSDRLELFPKGLKITNAKYRWGSCSRDSRLSISWKIMMAPLSVIDYVIIHELVHIKEKNHSKRFWTYLETILPDYREHRIWLKENGHRLWL